MPGYKKALPSEGFFISPRSAYNGPVRAAFVPVLAAHTVLTLTSLAGLLSHAWLRVPPWLPEVRTFAWMTFAAILLAPGLVLVIALLCRPRDTAAEPLRLHASRRMKRMLGFLAATFLSGGMLVPFIDRRGISAGIGQFSVGLMGCAFALFVIVTPWIALYSRTFDVNPS